MTGFKIALCSRGRKQKKEFWHLQKLTFGFEKIDFTFKPTILKKLNIATDAAHSQSFKLINRLTKFIPLLQSLYKIYLLKWVDIS